MNSLDRLVFHEAVHNILKIFSTLDHVDNEHSLEIAIILNDVFLERLITSANSKEQAVSLDFANKSLRSHQVVVIFDPENGESDVHLIDVLRDQIINRLSRSWLELHRSISKNILTLLVNFLLRESHKICIIE